MIILDPTDNGCNFLYKYGLRRKKNKQGDPDGWEITWIDDFTDLKMSFNNKGVLVYNSSETEWQFAVVKSDSMEFDDDGKLRCWELHEVRSEGIYWTKFDDKGLVLKTDDDFWDLQVRRRTERLNADRNRKE